MAWFGLGKPRSKFGKWIDRKGITQQELAERSGVGRNLIGRLANENERCPTRRTAQRLMRTMREVDPDVHERDFWDV